MLVTVRIRVAEFVGIHLVAAMDPQRDTMLWTISSWFPNEELERCFCEVLNTIDLLLRWGIWIPVLVFQMFGLENSCVGRRESCYRIC